MKNSIRAWIVDNTCVGAWNDQRLKLSCLTMVNQVRKSELGLAGRASWV